MDFIHISREKSVPYTNKKTGFSTELHSISFFATQLGRSAKTVRAWEIAGTIPATPFRVNGERMYCNEQIEIAVNLAFKYQISNGRIISRTGFKNAIHKEWKELYKKIFGDVYEED